MIMAPSDRAMRTMLAICDKFATEYCVTFNNTKSKCITFNYSKAGRDASAPLPSFAIGGNVIENIFLLLEENFNKLNIFYIYIYVCAKCLILNMVKEFSKQIVLVLVVLVVEIGKICCIGELMGKLASFYEFVKLDNYGQEDLGQNNKITVFCGLVLN